MNAKIQNLEMRVGIFVSLGLGICMFAIIFLGGSRYVLTNSASYFLHVDNDAARISCKRRE